MSFDAHNIEVGVSLYSGMAAKRQKGPLHKSLSTIHIIVFFIHIK